MTALRVIMRPPSAAFRRALSQHAERDRIDPDRAVRQHAAYAAVLRSAGVEVVMLPPDPRLPDAPFTSDTVLAFGDGRTDLLVSTRPAAGSRRAEVASVRSQACRLAPAASVHAIVAPGTLEGGDVIIYGRRVAIGVSARTNDAGAQQLAGVLEAAGYEVFHCPVRRYLHLASAVTPIGARRLIGTPRGFGSLDAAGAVPADAERIVIPEEDVVAANVLAIAERCFIAAGYPGAVEALRQAGELVTEVELGEFIRADGGPTCLVAPVP